MTRDEVLGACLAFPEAVGDYPFGDEVAVFKVVGKMFALERHWNTVDLDGSVDDDEFQEMIRHSYDLVVGGLPRREHERLAQQ